MAQRKLIAQGAVATKTLDEDSLGWRPYQYDAHTISLHDAGANTATVYAYPVGQTAKKVDVVTLENQDAITMGSDSGPWEKFEISFSDSGGAANVYITSK
mgnify:CR=1 FL=1|tara:strand:- start:491 stop:790 length:300 start_codon:yes stop_codon:yes gene_type:complete